MQQSIPETLATKKHFEILDGLRGIAALAVVVFHFMEWIYPDPKNNFIGHGFLAVDFFFCLSGFVIAYAYDSRIKTIGLSEFFKSRLIRLHPLVILGSVLGLLGLLLDPFENSNYESGWLALIFICSALVIPFPVMEARFFNLFGLNAPAWSLFWEYIANILYALVLHKLRRSWLRVLAIIAAVVLCVVAYKAGNLMGGWSRDNFLHGGARVFYSFLAGMLIFRCNWIISNKLGFAGLSVFLTLAFLMPVLELNWLTESIIVIFYFPLIVSLGAGALLSPGLKPLCKFSGDLSYPLYMTHYAWVWVFGHYFTNIKPGSSELTGIVVGGTLFLVGFAYLMMKVYDFPLRKYLQNKRRGSFSSDGQS